jgi:acyl-CoA thioester hydrolase
MKHISKIGVRFADIDAMGHVNNAVYLNYFEQARMAFFNDSVGSDWDWRKDGIVLARNEVDYISPIFLQDNVSIETLVESIGRKSMTLSYEVFKAKGEKRHLFAKGKSVIVSFNYLLGKTTEIPERWRESFLLYNKR